MKLTLRHFSYPILATFCIVSPFIVTVMIIFFSQDRIVGMKLGVIPGILIPHLIYGLIFLQFPKLKKFIYSLLLSLLILGINIILIKII